MLQSIIMTLLATASLHGNHPNGLIAGEVSPEPKSSAVTSADEEVDETGEVDEDIMITEEEDSNDDEGIN